MSTAAVVETPVPRARRAVSGRAIAAASCLAIAHIPLVWSYTTAIIELPHYGFVLLLPIGAAVLAWPRINKLGVLKPGGTVGFLAWITPAVFGLLIAVVHESPWVGAISALFALMAVVYAVGGRRFVMSMMAAWIVLWMGIRLPLTADETLAQKLQEIAADRAGIVLDSLGQLHLLDGNVVETPTDSIDSPTKRYMVEEACSGVQSLFAITACTVFFSLWMRETWWRAILLLVAAWWWVWVANVGRVVLVTYLNSNFGWKVDEGNLHDALGIGLFIITLALIISTEHLMLFFLPRGLSAGNDRPDEQPAAEADFGKTTWPAASRTKLASIPLTLGYSLLIVGQWLLTLREPEASATPVNLEGTLVREFAPQEYDGWALVEDGYKSEQRRSDSQWGARSQSWRYRKGTQELVVSVDYPFRGWHELTICYEADGWQRKSRDVIGVPKAGGSSTPAKAEVTSVSTSIQAQPCVRALFHRPDISAYGFLLFGSFNDRQDPIPVPRGGRDVLQKLRDRLVAFVERVRTLGASGNGLNDQTQSYQLQVFMQSFVPSAESDRTGAAKLFAEFQSRLARNLKPGETN